MYQVVNTRKKKEKKERKAKQSKNKLRLEWRKGRIGNTK
jgi:hypothetical protein